jgi:hypothetical protein
MKLKNKLQGAWVANAKNIQCRILFLAKTTFLHDVKVSEEGGPVGGIGFLLDPTNITCELEVVIHRIFEILLKCGVYCS